jgi:hypothetical protein
MKQLIFAALAAALLLAGCSTSSISNPGGDYNAFYQGELNEIDLIGPTSGSDVTGAEIAAALNNARPLSPNPATPVLLIQSGAILPDTEMAAALGAHFEVVPFSGVPPKQGEAYGQRLRMIAALGGYRQILCYWGALEAQRKDGITKALSWVPIVGAIVPDETQRMRIDLKAVLIDVESGRWRVYRTAPIEDTAISARIDRAESGEDQVSVLKTQGYKALADAVSQTARQ